MVVAVSGFATGGRHNQQNQQPDANAPSCVPDSTGLNSISIHLSLQPAVASKR